MLSRSEFLKEIEELQQDPDHGVLYVIEHEEFTPKLSNPAVYGMLVSSYHRVHELGKAIAKRVQEKTENALVEDAVNSVDSGLHRVGEGGGAGHPPNDTSNAEEEKKHLCQQGRKSKRTLKEMDANSVENLVESDIYNAMVEETEKDAVDSSDSGVHGIGEGVGEVWVAGHTPKDTSNAEEEKLHMRQQDQKLEHTEEILRLTQFITGANERLKTTQARCEFLLKLGNHKKLEECMVKYELIDNEIEEAQKILMALKGSSNTASAEVTYSRKRGRSAMEIEQERNKKKAATTPNDFNAMDTAGSE